MSKKGGLTRAEQIAHDKKEIERLENRIKQNEAKEKEKERKARTKRLIELGAIVESKLSEKAIAGLKILAKENLQKVDEWLSSHYDAIKAKEKQEQEKKKSNIEVEKEPEVGRLGL